MKRKIYPTLPTALPRLTRFCDKNTLPSNILLHPRMATGGQPTRKGEHRSSALSPKQGTATLESFRARACAGPSTAAACSHSVSVRHPKP